MPTADEFFRSGHLKEAVAASMETVKTRPGDQAARHLLWQLLCFAGDLERADKHLDILLEQDRAALPYLMLARQLVRAEQARRQFFAEGRLPEFIGKPSPALELRLKAAVHLRDGDLAAASALIQESDAATAPLAGQAAGQPFDGFRDADDLTATIFEVLTSTGKYYWIAADQVEEVEFHKPETPCDLLWRHATMTVRNGPDGAVYVPAIYASTAKVDDDHAKLGRSTEWLGGNGAPVYGVGLRLYMLGETDKTIMELSDIHFQNTPAGN